MFWSSYGPLHVPSAKCGAMTCWGVHMREKVSGAPLCEHPGFIGGFRAVSDLRPPK